MKDPLRMNIMKKNLLMTEITMKKNPTKKTRIMKRKSPTMRTKTITKKSPMTRMRIITKKILMKRKKAPQMLTTAETARRLLTMPASLWEIPTYGAEPV